jgi:hypothetical protein
MLLVPYRYITGATAAARPHTMLRAREVNARCRWRVCGIGLRWRRRKRPISPSTPPFSCARSMPGAQK